MALKDLLKGRHVPRSFDIIGNREKAVAIVEIKDGKGKKDIAEAIMKLHKNVKTVLEKASPRSGIYRVSRLKIIIGSKNTEVIHKECGFRFRLDPRKVYFSVRESTERGRIAHMIKPGETVMIFFAGIGPFAIHAARKTSNVIGIEINPAAVRYFKENAKLNKTCNITIVQGDVKKEAASFYGTCNRVLMPLPESAHLYLNGAVQCLKHGGVCHFYCFATETGLKEKKELIKDVAKKCGRRLKFTGVQRVLPWGPGIYKYRIDFIVF